MAQGLRSCSVLSDSLGLWGSNVWSVFTIALVLYIPGLIIGYCFLPTMPELKSILESSDPMVTMNFLLNFATIVIVLSFIIQLLQSVATLLLFIQSTEQEEDASAAEALCNTFRFSTTGRFFVQLVIISCVVMLGLFVFVFPGLYFAIMFSLAPVVLLAERKSEDSSLLGAISKSAELMKKCLCSGCCLTIVAPQVAGMIVYGIGHVATHAMLLKYTQQLNPSDFTTFAGMMQDASTMICMVIAMSIVMSTIVQSFSAAILVQMYTTLTAGQTPEEGEVVVGVVDVEVAPVVEKQAAPLPPPVVVGQVTQNPLWHPQAPIPAAPAVPVSQHPLF
eukprot:TRINITY_DN68194_c2_g4_i1.p1 TRINITY_DN68194_c2_g4~~TRINITY_DN68194_c2_g4_i1.p1  ORF type:complete len:343 (+),score=62.26 TRINITY_DN68194_c2_g4_i1:28-1029(+)